LYRVCFFRFQHNKTLDLNRRAIPFCKASSTPVFRAVFGAGASSALNRGDFPSGPFPDFATRLAAAWLVEFPGGVVDDLVQNGDLS